MINLNNNDEIENFLLPEEKLKDLESKEVLEVVPHEATNGKDFNNNEHILIDLSDSNKENLGIKEEDLREVNLTLEEVLKISKERGETEALEYVKKLKEEKISKKENEEKNNQISLSTKSFISPLTGEEVHLNYLNTFDRISEIYYHTGISVKINDPVLLSGYARGLSNFSDYLVNLDPYFQNKLEVSIGPNWQQTLLEGYNKAWNRIMSEEIEKEKQKGADRLKEYEKAKKEKEEVEVEENKASSVTRVMVKKVNKEELKDLRKDLLKAKKTAVLSNNGNHIVYKGGIAYTDKLDDNNSHIRK